VVAGKNRRARNNRVMIEGAENAKLSQSPVLASTHGQNAAKDLGSDQSTPGSIQLSGEIEPLTFAPVVVLHGLSSSCADKQRSIDAIAAAVR
jgi:hypothetical protein